MNRQRQAFIDESTSVATLGAGKEAVYLNVTAQNLVVNFEAAPLQPSKINNDFPKTAFLPPNFEQLNLNHSTISPFVLQLSNKLSPVGINLPFTTPIRNIPIGKKCPKSE